MNASLSPQPPIAPVIVRSPDLTLLHRIAFTLISFTVLVDILVFLGWGLDLAWLRKPLPGMVAVNPMTAVLFLLTAGGLYLVSRTDPARHQAARYLAVLLLLLAGLKLLDVLQLFDSGIDHWLFPEKTMMQDQGYPENNMSGNGALNFFLLGLALVFLRRNKPRLPQALALTTSLLALLSLIGYLYGVPAFYNGFWHFPMALPAAFNFLALGLALLFLTGDQGFMNEVTSPLGGYKAARLLLPIAVVAPILLGSLRLYGESKLWYNPKIGLAGFVAAIILTFLILTWRIIVLINRTSYSQHSEIAERRQAESRIQANNLFLETILENIPNMIFVKNGQDLRFARINRAGEALLGISRENLVGKTDYDLFPREQADYFKTKDWEVFNNGTVLETEEPIITSQGPGWLRTKKIPVKDEQGQPLYIVGISEDITELKIQADKIKQFYAELEQKVEERTRELAASEARFRALIDNSTDGIAVVDAENCMRYQSPAVARMTGFREAKNHHQDRLFAIHPDDQELASRRWAEAHEHPGQPIPMLLRTRHALGHFIWVEGTVTNLLHEESIRGFVTNFRDVTHRKEAEVQLEEQNQRIVNILESITDGFFNVDRNWIITYWNREAEKIVQMPKELVLGRNLWEVYPHTTKYKFYHEYHRAMREMEAVHLVEFYEELGIWIDISAYPSPDGLAVYFKDVTKQHQAAEEIRLAKERYDLVVQTTNDAIWDWDVVHNQLLLGEGFRTLFGYDLTPDNQTLEARQSWIHPEDRDEVVASLLQMIEPGYPRLTWEKEYRFLRADGSIAYILDRGMVVRDSDGRALRMIGAMQDNTLRQQHQQEREKLIRELTQTNKDLRQFSYITSHNFRAPLSNLLGLLNLVKGIPVENALLSTILDGFAVSANNLNDTINDLLQVLVVKDSPSIHQQPVSVREVLDLMLSQIANLVEQSQPVITTELAVPVIIFNRTYLESILLNLLTNAIKYRSPDRPLEIRIRTEFLGDQTRLIFEDNGTGLDMARYRDRIFGLYQKFHQNPESKGLGLYLVKSQLEALGGTIEMESEKDAGARFFLTFINQQNYVG